MKNHNIVNIYFVWYTLTGIGIVVMHHDIMWLVIADGYDDDDHTYISIVQPQKRKQKIDNVTEDAFIWGDSNPKYDIFATTFPI